MSYLMTRTPTDVGNPNSLYPEKTKKCGKIALKFKSFCGRYAAASIRVSVGCCWYPF